MPAGAETFSRATPTMFWPRSKIQTPRVVSRNDLGEISPVWRTGSMTWLSSARGGSSLRRGRRPLAVVETRLVPAGQLLAEHRRIRPTGGLTSSPGWRASSRSDRSRRARRCRRHRSLRAGPASRDACRNIENCRHCHYHSRCGRNTSRCPAGRRWRCRPASAAA